MLAWAPPLFISFTVLWFLNGFLAYLVVRQSRHIRMLKRQRDHAETHAFAAIMFANCLAERGATVPCDDCGNMMSALDEIDILPKPDGSTYVGHRSHNRRSDWGLTTQTER